MKWNKLSKYLINLGIDMAVVYLIDQYETV